MARVAVAVALALCAVVASARPHVGPVPLPPNVLAPQRAFAFDAMKIKALQPDFYNASVIAQYNAGGVAANFVWADWEPAFVPAPCPNPQAQVEYDGHCFTVQSDVDGVVSAYSLGHHMNVHANVYGSPAWAATDPNCQPANGANGAIFCAPDNASDFARFAGFIAWRYGLLPNASGSNGYVNSFAVWNEVNTNAYFNVGCGSQAGAVPQCDITSWVQRYAQLWTAAYDAITAENSNALVEACFDHSFEEDFDKPTAAAPTISVKTFLSTLMPQIGADRVLRIAYHPYTTDLRTPTFSPDDFPYVTYGNLGALGGWLLSQWPERTELWNEISLTESGINSAAPDSSNGAQANGVCQSFWNTIGTPGIINYVYHRMLDNAQEGGLLLGLADESGAFKTSWSVWSQCNYQRFSCGFGNLPNTKLQRSKSPTRNHWVSTRLPPATYTFEKAWFLWRDAQFNATTGEPQTVPIFECLVGPIGGGGGNLLSFNPSCEAPSASVPLGLVGYAFTPANSNAQKFLVPLYRCVTTANTADHFVSGDSACEGQTTEALLGYVLPAGF